MIQQGTAGTSSGPGLQQILSQASLSSGGTVNAQHFYITARMYNSGAVAPSGDLGQGQATHCYASDIANRLTGWVLAPHECTLDG